MDWNEAVRRISDGEDTQAVLDEMQEADNERSRALLREEPNGAERLAEYDRRICDINLSIAGARSTWVALYAAQRRVLLLLVGGCWLIRPHHAFPHHSELT